MTATCLRGNGFCMEGDANLSRQLIHHFKPLPLLGSLPSPVCSEQALLTWVEEALECQGRFNSPLCKISIIKDLSGRLKFTYEYHFQVLNYYINITYCYFPWSYCYRLLVVEIASPTFAFPNYSLCGFYINCSIFGVPLCYLQKSDLW